MTINENVYVQFHATFREIYSNLFYSTEIPVRLISESNARNYSKLMLARGS